MGKDITNRKVPVTEANPTKGTGEEKGKMINLTESTVQVLKITLAHGIAEEEEKVRMMIVRRKSKRSKEAGNVKRNITQKVHPLLPPPLVHLLLLQSHQSQRLKANKGPKR